MRDRPIYISLLCIALILYSGAMLVRGFHQVHMPVLEARFDAIPLPHELLVNQYLLNYAVPLVCACFMLNGANWARVFYIAYGVASYLLLALFDPIKHDLQPDISIFALAAALLLLPGPRGYFLLPDHYT